MRRVKLGSGIETHEGHSVRADRETQKVHELQSERIRKEGKTRSEIHGPNRGRLQLGSWGKKRQKSVRGPKIVGDWKEGKERQPDHSTGCRGFGVSSLGRSPRPSGGGRGTSQAEGMEETRREATTKGLERWRGPLGIERISTRIQRANGFATGQMTTMTGVTSGGGSENWELGCRKGSSTAYSTGLGQEEGLNNERGSTAITMTSLQETTCTWTQSEELCLLHRTTARIGPYPVGRHDRRIIETGSQRDHIALSSQEREASMVDCGLIT